MQALLLFALGLVPSSAHAAHAGGRAHTTTSPSIQDLDQTFQELSSEYVETEQAWRAQLRSAPVAERKALRDQHPAKAFRGRFEALAEKGYGRALLWLAEQAPGIHESRSSSNAARVELYARLVRDHADEPWATEIVASVAKRKTHIGEELVRAHLAALGGSADAGVAASGMFELAKRLQGKRASEAELEQARALEDEILARYPDSQPAEAVLSKRSKKLFQEGATPPDFAALDADGVAFKLSDYRGKVVLLDFWGFW